MKSTCVQCVCAKTNFSWLSLFNKCCVNLKRGPILLLTHSAFLTFRSFVPPVRDEESETQRKAHAKRVRETRRSTQGVTLEDLKSAEQLVKKKQQQENQQRTSELQQLVASQQQQQQKYSPTTVPSVSVQQPSSGE